MTLNITFNPQKRSRNKQSSLSQGDKVYLYGDKTYTGTLIHPIERTYPPKWTVQLNRGGYEAVNIKQITIVESSDNQHSLQEASHNYESDLEIPFSDAKDEPVKPISELEREIVTLKKEKALLEAENQLIARRYGELERKNEILKKDLDQAKQVIRRAKDISPVMRWSLKRVLRLAHNARANASKLPNPYSARISSIH